LEHSHLEIVSQQKARRMMDMRRAFWVANYFFPAARNVKVGKIKRMKSLRTIELRALPYTNSHLKHGIHTASFPPRLCFVPLVRTSSTPHFTQLCRNEKSAMLDAMF
jgi:hypothetical protein